MRAELSAAAVSSPAAFTDIRFERRRGVSILHHGRRLQAITERSFTGGVVRCLAPGFAWGSCSFRSLDDLPSAIRRAHEQALALPPRPGPTLPSLPARQLAVQCLAPADPAAVSIARKLELTDLVAAALFGADRRVIDARVHYVDELVETMVVTSEGIALAEARPEFALSVIATADEAGTTERVVDSLAARSWSDLESGVATAPAIAERAVALLHAAPIRAGRYPIVLAPRAAGMMAHRVVGHLCEADGDSDVRAPLPLGTRVGPDSLTIGDDPTADGLRGTRAFDHEGLQPRKTTLVQHGVVVGHVHTRSSAARAGAAPTGSGYGVGLDIPRARLSNTFIASGKTDLADLLDGISLGILVEDLVGASLGGGRAELRAGFAQVIRHGEPSEPIKGVTLGGDALVLLGQIDLVGGDFEWDPAAAWCDRAGAGRIAVSTGAPHVRLVDVSAGDVA
ncbi:MAG TPA: TldD/PmbA family protein [Gemmatimonadales bacterium]